MNKSAIVSILKKLFSSQRFAVLSTSRSGQPYTSLVGFLATDDLQYFIFVTGRGTQKYQNIQAEPHVAFLVDNRSNREEDFQSAIAVTALGTAQEVNEDEKQPIARLFLDKHPTLTDFVSSQRATLFKVKIDRYLIVSEFQNVMDFNPAA